MASPQRVREWERGQGALTHACTLSICGHMLSRHNWRIYGTSWKRGGPERTRRTCRVLARIVLCLPLSLSLAEWIWSLYSQLSIVSAYCARCFTLFWLTRRANCSILRVGLHWPQRGKQAAIRVACGMWHAEHVEHWTEATLMISVRQCKTDKTHFQIVHLCYVTSARKYPRQIWGESGEMERAISFSRRDYNWGMS